MNSVPGEALPPRRPEDASDTPSVESTSATSASPDQSAAAGEPPTQRLSGQEGADPGGGLPGEESNAATSEGVGSAKPSGLRSRIQIGSRREPTDLPPSPAPRVTGADKPLLIVPPPPSATPVPPPSVRDPLSPDLERELAEALGDASLDELLGATPTDSVTPVLEVETRLRGPVLRMHGDHVFFSLGGRHEGVASLRLFAEPPAVGAEMDVIIKSYSGEDGLYELIIPGVSSHVEDWSDLTEGALVEVRITGANTGGLECKVGNIRGFIPASQIAMFRIEDYAEFLDQKLLCVVTEVNPRRKNLVLSRRAVLEREKEEARREQLESLEVGHVVDGVVRKILDFGAFVDIGGLDGLLHISQLSWDHVKHPSEVLQEGQKIRVKIEKVDQQTGKIGLSYRDLLEHPWSRIEEQFPVDTVARGTVTRIAKFGAFVKLAPGVEGLIHISELAHGRVPSVGSVVKEGQEVEVKVLSVDVGSQRMALSMKAVLPVPIEETPEGADAEEATPPARDVAVPIRQQPLKGGTGRDSGGDRFGLKW